MLTDVIKRDTPGLVTGSADPFPVLALDGVLKDGKKQGPLRVELLGPVGFLKVMPIRRIVMKDSIGLWVEQSRHLADLRHGSRLG